MRRMLMCVAAAKAAFEHFSQTSKSERLALLRRIRSSASVALKSLRRPCVLRWARPLRLRRRRQMRRSAPRWIHSRAGKAGRAECRQRKCAQRADGVQSPPLNWPINQVVLKVLIATGCLRAKARSMPVSAMLYAEILVRKAAGVFNLVQGVGPVWVLHYHHADIQMMSFTGSTAPVPRSRATPLIPSSA